MGASAHGKGEGSVDIEALRAREATFLGIFASLRTNVERWKKAKKRQLQQQIEKSCPLRAKAFPGRAAILIKLLGLDEKSVSAVYEKPGSLKIGHYLPGTRIPIRSDDELFALPDQTQPLLNLAWHIPREIRAYTAEHGYTGSVIDVLGAEDFAGEG